MLSLAMKEGLSCRSHELLFLQLNWTYSCQGLDTGLCRSAALQLMLCFPQEDILPLGHVWILWRKALLHQLTCVYLVDAGRRMRESQPSLLAWTAACWDAATSVV